MTKKITATPTPVHDRTRKWKRVAAITAITSSLVFLLPVTAYAEQPDFSVWSLGKSLKNIFCYMILDAAAWLFNVYNDIVSAIAGDTVISAPFDSLLGTDLYNLTSSVFESAVVPIGESILALFMLVQLVKISQRIDATSTLPAVKEIVFLAVIYVLLHWFINNSLDIMQAIYGLVTDNIIPSIGTAGETTGYFSDALSTDPITGDQWDDITVGGSFMTLFAAILSLIAGCICAIIAFVVAYARAWQIYIYAAFSPIPISLLGFEETRQMGIGYLKNFASACLAGAIMMFLFVAYPYILTGTIGQGGSDILFIASGGGQAILTLLKVIGVSIVLGYALLHSGAWAKEVLGS